MNIVTGAAEPDWHQAFHQSHHVLLSHFVSLPFWKANTPIPRNKQIQIFLKLLLYIISLLSVICRDNFFWLNIYFSNGRKLEQRITNHIVAKTANSNITLFLMKLYKYQHYSLGKNFLETLKFFVTHQLPDSTVSICTYATLYFVGSSARTLKSVLRKAGILSVIFVIKVSRLLIIHQGNCCIRNIIRTLGNFLPNICTE